MAWDTPTYSVLIAPVEQDGRPLYGFCDNSQRQVSVNVAAHHSDAHVRATLLHEMAHVGSPSDCGGHGDKFWEQLERLLQQGAPITIGNSEAPDLRVFRDAVPKKFPLCRKEMERVEALRQRQLTQACKGRPVQHLSDKQLSDEFGESEVVELPWKQALFCVGNQWGLLDIDGKPKNRWAGRIVEAGRKRYKRVRREFLVQKRLRSDMQFRTRYFARLN